MKKNIKHNKLLKIILIIFLVFEIIFIIAFLAYMLMQYKSANQKNDYGLGRPQKSEIATGKILSEQAVQNFSKEETLALIKQTDKDFNLEVKYPIAKQVFSYNTSDTGNDNVPVYARVYKPLGKSSKSAIFAFAPGTTGIGDQCASSLEQPSKHNWGNYDSLLTSYASQGYTVVVTDYEGMRDPARLHHYMVGELEGRAVLDSVRALSNLSTTKTSVDTKKIILGGYSQGGHSAFWGDKISDSYAPELKINGVVGFGPVDDVEKTLSDITKGANINWFGPYVFTSYQDYYKTSYPMDKILLPRWRTSMTNDVILNCVDSVATHWGKNPEAVYTKEFISALRDKTLLSTHYPQLFADFNKNIAGDKKTSSNKMINQGALDNVVLPDQQTQMINRLCKSGNKIVSYKSYPNVTHYDTMIKSFRDTLSWMDQSLSGKSLSTSCKN